MSLAYDIVLLPDDELADEAMADDGIDVSGSLRRQVSPEMLDEYDVVISMAQKEYTPEWLSAHQKYIYWDVADRGGKGLEATNFAKKSVREKVEELIADLPA